MVDFLLSQRTIVRVGIHCHIWFCRCAEGGTIRSMERDDNVYHTRRKANYALSDGRQYWFVVAATTITWPYTSGT